MVLNCHKAVQSDQCEPWNHNNCSYISPSEYEDLENSNCTWICPKCEIFKFSDSYFDTQCNLENPKRLEPLVRKVDKDANPSCRNKPTSINGLKFTSININSTKGKKLELVAFLTSINSMLWLFRRQKLTKLSPLPSSSRKCV